MELTFIKNERTGSYESEFEVTSDFNLHIERKDGGFLLLYQKTAGGGYDQIDDFKVQRHQPVIDCDFTALVYPKWIKVVSEVAPSVGVVTMAQ